MKFYLSSYKFGNEIEELKKLIPKNKKTAYISNALDFSDDLERRRKGEESAIEQFKNLNLDVEIIDLREYFNQKDKLEKKLNAFGIIWVRGGNCFVLRQAMKLSGFDNILKNLAEKNVDILYGGDSAGICVLAPTLKGIDFIDDLTQRPYGKQIGTIWEGLGILNYSIIPHYNSDHPESKDTDKTVRYMIKNKILFKVLEDGEVIIK